MSSPPKKEVKFEKYLLKLVHHDWKMLLGIVSLKRSFHLGRAKSLLGLLKSLRYQWLITRNLERVLIRINQVGH